MVLPIGRIPCKIDNSQKTQSLRQTEPTKSLSLAHGQPSISPDIGRAKEGDGEEESQFIVSRQFRT